MTDLLSTEEIAEARQLFEHTTPGPWKTWGCDVRRAAPGYDSDDSDLDHSEVVAKTPLRTNEHGGGRTDANFIALARTLLPRALDELEAARARIRTDEAAVHTLHAIHMAAESELKEAREQRDIYLNQLGAAANLETERDEALAELERLKLDELESNTKQFDSVDEVIEEYLPALHIEKETEKLAELDPSAIGEAIAKKALAPTMDDYIRHIKGALPLAVVAVDALRERDEARAEAKRLRIEIGIVADKLQEVSKISDDALLEVERLKKILGEQEAAKRGRGE